MELGSGTVLPSWALAREGKTLGRVGIHVRFIDSDRPCAIGKASYQYREPEWAAHDCGHAGARCLPHHFAAFMLSVAGEGSYFPDLRAGLRRAVIDARRAGEWRLSDEESDKLINLAMFEEMRPGLHRIHIWPTEIDGREAELEGFWRIFLPDVDPKAWVRQYERAYGFLRSLIASWASSAGSAMAEMLRDA